MLIQDQQRTLNIYEQLTVLHELDRLIAAPPFPVRRIAITVDIGRARSTDSPWLAEETTAERDVVDTGANLLVPARDDDTGRERVLILVA